MENNDVLFFLMTKKNQAFKEFDFMDFHPSCFTIAWFKICSTILCTMLKHVLWNCICVRATFLFVPAFTSLRHMHSQYPYMVMFASFSENIKLDNQISEIKHDKCFNMVAILQYFVSKCMLCFDHFNWINNKHLMVILLMYKNTCT